MLNVSHHLLLLQMRLLQPNEYLRLPRLQHPLLLLSFLDHFEIFLHFSFFVAGMVFQLFALISLDALLSHVVGKLDFHAFRRIQLVISLFYRHLAAGEYLSLFFERDGVLSSFLEDDRESVRHDLLVLLFPLEIHHASYIWSHRSQGIFHRAVVVDIMSECPGVPGDSPPLGAVLSNLDYRLRLLAGLLDLLQSAVLLQLKHPYPVVQLLHLCVC